MNRGDDASSSWERDETASPDTGSEKASERWTCVALTPHIMRTVTRCRAVYTASAGSGWKLPQ